MHCPLRSCCVSCYVISCDLLHGQACSTPLHVKGFVLRYGSGYTMQYGRCCVLQPPNFSAQMRERCLTSCTEGAASHARNLRRRAVRKLHPAKPYWPYPNARNSGPLHRSYSVLGRRIFYELHCIERKLFRALQPSFLDRALWNFALPSCTEMALFHSSAVPRYQRTLDRNEFRCSAYSLYRLHAAAGIGGYSSVLPSTLAGKGRSTIYSLEEDSELISNAVSSPSHASQLPLA